jgi:hypothetical protein
MIPFNFHFAYLPRFYPADTGIAEAVAAISSFDNGTCRFDLAHPPFSFMVANDARFTGPVSCVVFGLTVVANCFRKCIEPLRCTSPLPSNFHKQDLASTFRGSGSAVLVL